jgi:hypothetical protein
MIHHNLCECGHKVSCKLFILTNILHSPSDKGMSIMVWNTTQSHQIVASLNLASHTTFTKISWKVCIIVFNMESLCAITPVVAERMTILLWCWRYRAILFTKNVLSLPGVPAKIYSSWNWKKKEKEKKKLYYIDNFDELLSIFAFPEKIRTHVWGFGKLSWPWMKYYLPDEQYSSI